MTSHSGILKLLTLILWKECETFRSYIGVNNLTNIFTEFRYLGFLNKEEGTPYVKVISVRISLN
jgi:hypothetical protein